VVHALDTGHFLHGFVLHVAALVTTPPVPVKSGGIVANSATTLFSIYGGSATLDPPYATTLLGIPAIFVKEKHWKTGMKF
ncbi:MAG: hypothetical protein ACTSWM_06895, partial [Alphaproteobacteria bacterium]